MMEKEWCHLPMCLAHYMYRLKLCGDYKAFLLKMKMGANFWQTSGEFLPWRTFCRMWNLVVRWELMWTIWSCLLQSVKSSERHFATDVNSDIILTEPVKEQNLRICVSGARLERRHRKCGFEQEAFYLVCWYPEVLSQPVSSKPAEGSGLGSRTRREFLQPTYSSTSSRAVSDERLLILYNWRTRGTRGDKGHFQT